MKATTHKLGGVYSQNLEHQTGLAKPKLYYLPPKKMHIEGSSVVYCVQLEWGLISIPSNISQRQQTDQFYKSNGPSIATCPL